MAGEDRGPVVLAVTAAMIAGATIFICLRMVSRIAIVKKVTLDDWFIILAWVIAFGLSFIICYGTTFGLGQHESDINPDHRIPLAKAEYVFTVLYNPALMATKTSIGIFYLSLAETQKVFKWMTIATMAIVNVVGLALTFVNIFQCQPMSDLFDVVKPQSAHCTDIVTLYLSSAPVNILTDLALLLLPLPLLKEMHLPRKQKIILYITFSFGVFVTAVDVVRISYLQQASITSIEDKIGGGANKSSSNEVTASDFSWYASLSFMWSAIEVNVGIMCACVPSLKPLFSRFLPNLIRSAGEKESKYDASTSVDQTLPPMARATSAAAATSPTFENSPGMDDNYEGEMGFLDFLSSPDDDAPQIRRTQTAKTSKTQASHHTGKISSHHFDFVNMASTKSIVDMTNRESILPIAEVTLLFFLWGFAYGLLNTLNAQFQTVAGITTGQSEAIHAIYYVGYFIGPLTFGRLVLKTWGFKACYMVGLVIYGTGTLVFWPSAVLLSFGAFLVSNFIVGLGLSSLEIAANPFIALCGPLEYAEVRLNLSQAIQACGTVVSLVLAKKALFNNVLNSASLVDVQWTYLAITLFTFLLAFVYYCLKLPEGSDADFARSATRTYSSDTLCRLHRTKTILITLGLAVFAQLCYVGGQEAVSTSFETYITFVTGPQGSSNTKAWDFDNTDAIAHTLFAVSRFLAAFLGMGFQRYGLKPRHLLAFFFFGAIVFAALSAATASSSFNTTPTTSAVFALMVYFFEGPLFSLIFAIPLRALGSMTKDGSALLTAAIGGGAIFSPISVAAISAQGPRLGMIVQAAAFVGGSVFPIYLAISRLAKAQIDPIHLDGTESEREDEDFDDAVPGSTLLDNLRKRGLQVLTRRKKGSSDGGSEESVKRAGKQRADGVEYVEKKEELLADGNDFLTSAL